MEIIYTKEGMKIIHSTGVVQVLSVEGLTRHWEHAKKREKETEQHSKRIYNDIKKVEALQQK